MKPAATLAILGAGSWGTAVAIHIAKQGHTVFLWGHSPKHIEQMKAQRCNPLYLPDISFPTTLMPVAELSACSQADYLIIAVPSHAFVTVLNQLKKPPRGLAWLTKGIDPQKNDLLSELVAKKWGPTYPVAIISGPSFAREVAQGLPTAIIMASNDEHYVQALCSLIHNDNLRVYFTDDIRGVQICGAVKNVLAIACGISDGLNFGANAKAALITRGLAEMSRLGMALGAKTDTFMGLAGLGDLVLTCTDDQSRNRRFGLALGKGMDIAAAEKYIGQVVEGKHNAAQVCALATTHHVEMPICQEVNQLLLNKTTPQQAVMDLMTRPLREE